MNALSTELSLLVERLRKRIAGVESQIVNCQRIVDLMQPEMALFEAREGKHNVYAARMSVDHESSIRTLTKELADLTEAADTIIAQAEALEVAREAITCAEAWLDSWALHVGSCAGGDVCECGLTRIKFDCNQALARIAALEKGR